MGRHFVNSVQIVDCGMLPGAQWTALLPGNEDTVYAVLDAAAITGLPAKLQALHASYYCLLRGRPGPDLAAVSPYLVALHHSSGFTRWLFSDRRRLQTGLYCVAGAGTDTRRIRSHFRALLTSERPDGAIVYFRYYDPRVWHEFLPLTDFHQARQIFGCIRQFYAARDGNDTWLQYSLPDARLLIKELRCAMESG